MSNCKDEIALLLSLNKDVYAMKLPLGPQAIARKKVPDDTCLWVIDTTADIGIDESNVNRLWKCRVSKLHESQIHVIPCLDSTGWPFSFCNTITWRKIEQYGYYLNGLYMKLE